MSGRNTKSTQVKVKRYRAGQAPAGVDINEYSSSSDEERENLSTKQKSNTPEPMLSVKTMNINDPRLQRLNKTEGSNGNIDRKEMATRYSERLKNRYDTESESENELGVKEEDSDGSMDREEMRKLAIKNQQVYQQEEEKAKAESEEESEYSTESSSEEERILLKPVFVKKSDRVTIQEKERKEREAIELEKEKEKEIEKKKLESKKLAEQVVRKELEDAIIQSELITEVDDTDGVDAEAEKQAWRLRELIRIKRDKQEKAEREAEAAEIERRRQLTEEERIKEDLEKKHKQMEEKEKLRENSKKNILQRWHHKGAFYLDKNDEIFQRNYNDATPDAVKNIEALPEVRKVKNFGLAGRTKYTHLADQDTSKKDSPWFQGNNELVDKSLKKLGGMHDRIELKKKGEKERKR